MSDTFLPCTCAHSHHVTPTPNLRFLEIQSDGGKGKLVLQQAMQCRWCQGLVSWEPVPTVTLTLEDQNCGSPA